MARTLRKGRDGEEYWSISYYDPKTQGVVRLPKSQTQHLKSEKEAAEFEQKLEAKNEVVKLKIQQRLEWRERFYDFGLLADEYVKYMQRKAPNTWANNKAYLEQYVFNFFLNVVGSNNLNDWHMFYSRFEEHLLEIKKAKGKGTLAYNTRNHIISTLNSFLEYMASKNNCETQRKMPLFPDHLMNVRGIESLISEEDAKAIHTQLVDIDPDSADLFIVLMHTGLRINESFGLSLDDLFMGEPDDENTKQALKLMGLKSYAYIFLTSQPALSTIRDANGTVHRKRLKHKDKVQESDSYRTIPVCDKSAASILARRYNEQVEKLNEEKFGKNRSDYLLFNEMYYQKFDRNLRHACESAKVTLKTAHCIRHTYATNLAAKCFGNPHIVKNVLGHTDLATTAKYIHLSGLLKRKLEAKKTVNSGRFIIED